MEREQMANRQNQFKLFFLPQLYIHSLVLILILKLKLPYICKWRRSRRRSFLYMYDEYINFKLVVKYWLFHVYCHRIQTGCTWLEMTVTVEYVHWGFYVVVYCVCVCVAFSNLRIFIYLLHLFWSLRIYR